MKLGGGVPGRSFRNKVRFGINLPARVGPENSGPAEVYASLSGGDPRDLRDPRVLRVLRVLREVSKGSSGEV